MADYDSFSYEINNRLPEWWKNDALAFPINKYTQDLIAEILYKEYIALKKADFLIK